eukprot:m.129232 g.129232  ORF g.129232 m.129232 type:complete len:84 (+) comp37970_c0_seq2:76-327(+)
MERSHRRWNRSDDFLGKCADRAESLCEDFLPKSIAISAWSFAVLHYPVPSLLAKFNALAQTRLNDFSIQAISNLLWAGAVFKT